MPKFLVTRLSYWCFDFCKFQNLESKWNFIKWGKFEVWIIVKIVQILWKNVFITFANRKSLYLDTLSIKWQHKSKSENLLNQTECQEPDSKQMANHRVIKEAFCQEVTFFRHVSTQKSIQILKYCFDIGWHSNSDQFLRAEMTKKDDLSSYQNTWLVLY